MNKYGALKEYFGYDEFRAGQERAIDALLAGRDALCVMPTGAGKSLCYQIPAALLPGVTLVISPLISLMQDQVTSLNEAGIPCVFINSTLDTEQYLEAFDRVRSGECRLAYIAPERLESARFRRLCKTLDISLIAVDEAHCISQWGHDFRPSYLAIEPFIASLKARPAVGAFTATATVEVREDICRSLQLHEPERVITGFDRPNLNFEVLHPRRKLDELKSYLSRHPDNSGIVYCSTRSTTDDVCRALVRSGYSALPYHAGLDSLDRVCNQVSFINDNARIMVATNAFGMGIDKSNVNFVIHYNMPTDLESYYQEAGRAGRDGAPADCILYYAPSDAQTARYLIGTSGGEDETLAARGYSRLAVMMRYCMTSGCLRSFILKYFGEEPPERCGNCGNCSAELQTEDITVPAQMVLSCVARTEGHFGAKVITGILRGSKDEQILRLGLDKLSTYGIMAKYTAVRVREIINYLIDQGYLLAKPGKYPLLMLSPSSGEVLRGGKQVIERRRSTAGRNAGSEDTSLLAELKALRRSIASERRIAPYMVFTDITLISMAAAAPRTYADLLKVPGVGEVKLLRYGKQFLEKIIEVCGNE